MFTTLKTEIMSCALNIIDKHAVPRIVFLTRTAPNMYSAWYANSFSSVQFHRSFPAQAKLIRRGAQTYLIFNGDPKGQPIKVEYSAQLTDVYMQSLTGSKSH